MIKVKMLVILISLMLIFQSLQNDLAVVFCNGLVAAVERHVQKADRDRASGDTTWWKAYESVLFAVSISTDTIIKQIISNKVTFDLNNFVEVVVKPSLDPACENGKQRVPLNTNLCIIYSGKMLEC